ncbi:hypothetical protein BGW80DRAFT_1258679 [Lactifluus volemus]|nr:hypothetical protein BGW80DRAFT_1258679 [Lactifluus volemus]
MPCDTEHMKVGKLYVHTEALQVIGSDSSSNDNWLPARRTHRSNKTRGYKCPFELKKTVGSVPDTGREIPRRFTIIRFVAKRSAQKAIFSMNPPLRRATLCIKRKATLRYGVRRADVYGWNFACEVIQFRQPGGLGLETRSYRLWFTFRNHRMHVDEVRSWVRIPSSISPQSSGGNDYQFYGVTGTPSPSPGARVAVRVRVAARTEEGRGEKRKGRVTVQRG